MYPHKHILTPTCDCTSPHQDYTTCVLLKVAAHTGQQHAQVHDNLLHSWLQQANALLSSPRTLLTLQHTTSSRIAARLCTRPWTACTLNNTAIDVAAALFHLRRSEQGNSNSRQGCAQHIITAAALHEQAFSHHTTQHGVQTGHAVPCARAPTAVRQCRPGAQCVKHTHYTHRP